MKIYKNILSYELSYKQKKSSDNLFSQQGNSQVSLALFCLTSVFGMGTGITEIIIITRKLSYAI